MALIKAESAYGFSGLPVLRQLGLMIGLAGSVALGVAVVLWSQEPSYTLLYGNLSGMDSSQVLDSLQKSNIPYKVDDSSGAIMVQSDQVHKARLKLASDGLPRGNGVGFELFNKEQDMGTSKFIEQARYQHAIEIELARSIMTMRSVRTARVHLAIPKRSVFIRKKEFPTASVVLDLFAGHNIDSGQTGSIVNMVASSVPGLKPEHITVVDQAGNLLSRVRQNNLLSATSGQFEFTRQLEGVYKKRIEDLLSPIIGPGRVRAQVMADIDFTSTEKTRESFNPDMPALRSEQTMTETSNAGMGASGTPGALSNQPPTGGTTEQASGGAATGSGGATEKAAPEISNSKITRNYELDKTISHTRSPAGMIRRLSVAVLVDDLKKVEDDGTITRSPLKEAAITRLITLVKETVGFDSSRGDSVNVINASFYVPEKPEALPELGLFEQAWVMDLIKQGVGVLIVILMIFGVLRPVLRGLAEKGEIVKSMQMVNPSHEGMAEDSLHLSGVSGEGGAVAQLPHAGQVDQQITTAKGMAAEDPARVAQVVKTWVGNE